MLVIDANQGDIEDIAAKIHPSFHPGTEESLEFPAALLKRVRDEEASMYCFDNGASKCYRPVSKAQVLELLAKYPSAKVVNGNTEVGIEVRFKAADYPVTIFPSDIPELQALEIQCMLSASTLNCDAS